MLGFNSHYSDVSNFRETRCPEKTISSEAEAELKDIFHDDFEGTEGQEADRPMQECDTKDVMKYLFAGDFEKKTETANESPGNSRETSDAQINDVQDLINNADESNEKNDNDDAQEYDEDRIRELTDDEKQMLKDKLGWSDKKINDNCRIDKEGTIHYKTDCQDKEGTTSECGVPYERKTIIYKGVKIEGVFPVFNSVFDTELDEADYQNSNGKQFSECNRKLKEAIENDSEVKDRFTDEQLEDIEKERTPRGYTWHHAEEPGKMQLVKTEDHDKRIGGAAHTGGNSIWGNKSMDKGVDSTEQKGESF